MYEADGCGPAHIVPNSSTLQEQAEKCGLKGFAQYYDGCAKKCVTDKLILPLSHHEQLENIVYGQIFPVLVLLAVLANMAVALVLSKKHMITPTNVVLKYMAIAELLVGLVPLPWTLFFFTMGNYKRTHRLELWWCYLQKYSMDAFPPVFHNIAMWLTVLLAAQRYISISYPLYSRATCSVRNVRYATFIITLISLLCGLPKSFDYVYDTVDGWVYMHGNWKYTKSCVMMQTNLLDLMGQTVFFNIYFWTRALGFIILPSVSLVILNALLIKGIRKAQKRKLRLLKSRQVEISMIILKNCVSNTSREKRSEEAARQRDSNSTSLMLVAIVSIFLIVNLPQAAFMVVLCVCETFGIRLPILDGMFPAVFLLTSNMIVMATYPLNFSIYCFMSSSFRQTFKALFCSRYQQTDYDRKREVSNVNSSRRPEYCTQLVNICTETEGSTQLTSNSHRGSDARFSIHSNNRLTPYAVSESGSQVFRKLNI